MATGIVMSDPRPVDVNIGSSARMVVALVIRQGRTRRNPAWTVASRMPADARGGNRSPDLDKITVRKLHAESRIVTILSEGNLTLLPTGGPI
jgi:hypothetical protein